MDFTSMDFTYMEPYMEIICIRNYYNILYKLVLPKRTKKLISKCQIGSQPFSSHNSANEQQNNYPQTLSFFVLVFEFEVN